MPVAVAAIVNGRRLSIAASWERQTKEERERARKAARKKAREERQQMAAAIIAEYAKDDSKSLSKDELRVFLRDVASSLGDAEDEPPTDEDVDFLFKLCDVSASDSISEQEVMGVIDAFGDFRMDKERLVKLVKTHDIDNSGDISKAELQEVLDVLKDEDHLKCVPPEVTTWIFEQADLSGTGVLCVMELARALCAYEMWLDNRSAKYRMLHSRLSMTPDLPPPEPMSDAEWNMRAEQKAKTLELLRAHGLGTQSQFQLQAISTLLIDIGLPSEKAASLTKVIDSNGDCVITINEFLNWIFSESADAQRTLERIAPASSLASRSSACTIL
eukprot:TRINITY_DN24313_c0_g1_i1.p1 TRINITY_DN24313_c0_g1~~TRINITY_DN24313_c0_g1_i1.p1  ORF type:complete len:330 (-),score=78.85 TRINITY_DN24313_c0_g1_i1:36-1025(-)